MRLLGSWKMRIESALAASPLEETSRWLLPTPVDLPRVARDLLVVDDGASARRLHDILRRNVPSAIAFDSEYRFPKKPIELKNGRDWYDVRSQVPICFSIAVWCASDRAGGAILRAVLDARAPAVVAALREILLLRVPFVFHHVKPELFSLWALGLDVPITSFWDTYLAAACLNLGSHHRRAAKRVATTESEQIEIDGDLDEQKAHLLSLVGQCERYGLTYPYTRDSKDRFRDRFLALREDDRIAPDMLEYSAADAEWTLRVYLAQQQDVLRQGIHAHLHTIEFPFAVANARMEWNGVHIDPKRMARVRDGAKKATEHYGDALVRLGVDPPGSVPKLIARLKRLDLARLLERDGEISTRDDSLEPIEHADPAIFAVRRYRKYKRLASEEWLTGALVGADGRTHPEHRQLGAATGRNSCTTPNIAGIGRTLRPIVEAPTGCALIELDYAQIEVGVAGAEYGDPGLVEAYNSGDVYAAMAKRFYSDSLSTADCELPAGEFKKRHATLRDRMKVFVLATLYGITVESLATRFNVTVAEAKREHDRFLGLFPVLRDRLQDQEVLGPIRGEATVLSGLRRRIDRRGRSSTWVRNVMRNTPIQGSAAIVFKKAVIDLDREFLGTDVKLVLPVHDAVVIECPEDQVDDVAARTERVMQAALRAYYPQLVAKVDVNKSAPRCWNKDGHADSLESFLSNPEFSLDRPVEECVHVREEPELPVPVPVTSNVAPNIAVDVGLDDFPLIGPTPRRTPSRLPAAFQRKRAQSRPDWIDGSSDAFRDASDLYEERAALFEFEGGLDRSSAEDRALDLAAAALFPDVGDAL